MKAEEKLYGYGKVSILKGPTPLELLANVSKDLGVNVYCKRDDLTPLAAGGNKLRKLEYLVKDASAYRQKLTSGGSGIVARGPGFINPHISIKINKAR